MRGPAHRRRRLVPAAGGQPDRAGDRHADQGCAGGARPGRRRTDRRWHRAARRDRADGARHHPEGARGQPLQQDQDRRPARHHLPGAALPDQETRHRVTRRVTL